MRILLALTLPAAAFATLIACSTEEFVPPEPALYLVSYGESFGECVGYCTFEVVLTGIDAGVTAIGDDEVIESVIDLTTDGDARWNEIAVPIQTQLEPVYGCPDCDDGGAAWVVLTDTDGNQSRHEFEAGNPPDALVDVADFGNEVLSASLRCETTDMVRMVGLEGDCTPVFAE